MADLLAAATDSGGDREGVGIATIMRKGNVSHPRALEMLRTLVQTGLIAELNRGERTRYAVTEDGFRISLPR